MSIQLKQPEQLQKMRDAGRIVAETLQLLKEEVRPGITTADIDYLAEKNIRRHGAVPSFKHYRGFPASTCISVNEEVVHGIPGSRVLNDGDIVSIDTGARYRGYHGDATITVPVGTVSSETADLVRVCFESLDLGIETAQVGRHLTDISSVIQDYVEAAGYNVVRDLYGHGIGRSLHEEPMLPHYGLPGHGPVLRAGMVITIEPMIVAGMPATKTLRDDWTVVTLDGSWAAQFEHTVAITDDGPEVLTRFP